jgi:hypothetical protein
MPSAPGKNALPNWVHCSGVRGAAIMWIKV